MGESILQDLNQKPITYSKVLSILSIENLRGIVLLKSTDNNGQTCLTISSEPVIPNQSNIGEITLSKNFDGSVTLFYNNGEYDTKFESMNHFMQTLQYKAFSSQESMECFGGITIKQILGFFNDFIGDQNPDLFLVDMFNSKQDFENMPMRVISKTISLTLYDEKTKDIVTLRREEELDENWINEDDEEEHVAKYFLEYEKKHLFSEEGITYKCYKGKTINREFLFYQNVNYDISAKHAGLIKRLIAHASKKKDKYLTKFNLSLLDENIDLEEVQFAVPTYPNGL